jgi:hypothetical protein
MGYPVISNDARQTLPSQYKPYQRPVVDERQGPVSGAGPSVPGGGGPADYYRTSAAYN